jgi:hypothetical protein
MRSKEESVIISNWCWHLKPFYSLDQKSAFSRIAHWEVEEEEERRRRRRQIQILTGGKVYPGTSGGGGRRRRYNPKP